ncbi:MAG: FAD-dependent oxidoreductase [Terrimicrobiaceae bacterium]|nr:FAD-dependent oxidoreductase [Terrimicrobiaceae bacterium]
MSEKKVLIIGGVAGGASCAARLRRLDESAEIQLIDRGPHVSFANCGLPYFIGGLIPAEQDLPLADARLFRERFGIRVRTGTEAVAIDRAARTVTLRDVSTGAESQETYDALVLSPGASPIRPPWPKLDGVFTLRTIPDSVAIKEWIATKKPRKAVVIGGGFIGLEMADNLVHLGLGVTVVEMLDQVMPPLDPEMAAYVEAHLEASGVKTALGDGVARLESADNGELVVRTASGQEHRAGLVVLAIGVKPETRLAEEAGLELGARGIKVDEQMRTSDPHIWAVGDAVEVREAVLGGRVVVPLAGPANRQGRVAADSICGRASRFRGIQGTAICGVFGLQVASTGLSEKALVRAGIEGFEKVYLHPNQHAGYYPGAKPMHLKLLFEKATGRILGAQGVGLDGVDRRIDLIAMAIQMYGTVADLAEAELCYAPQFGGAKDPVNLAGMIATNVVQGDHPLAHWNVPPKGEVILDVREKHEFEAGHVAGAVNIPLGQLRSRIDELRGWGEILVYCQAGQRGYIATRILLQHGIPARNISGGWAMPNAWGRAA